MSITTKFTPIRPEGSTIETAQPSFRTIPFAAGTSGNFAPGTIIRNNAGFANVATTGETVLGIVTNVFANEPGGVFTRGARRGTGDGAGYLEYFPFDTGWGFLIGEDLDGGAIAIDAGFVDITAQTVRALDPRTDATDVFVAALLDSSTANASVGSLIFRFRASGTTENLSRPNLNRATTTGRLFVCYAVSPQVQP